MTLDGRYFFVSNIDLGVTRWTADAVRDFGLPYDKMYGGVPDWIDHVHPEDRAGVLAEFRDITSGKKHHHEMEYRVRDAEGDYVVCKSRGFRLTGDDRRPALFVGSLTNRNASEYVDPATGIENVTGMLNLIGDCRLKGRGACAGTTAARSGASSRWTRATSPSSTNGTGPTRARYSSGRSPTSCWTSRPMVRAWAATGARTTSACSSTWTRTCSNRS